jgi:hypothetical protein
MPAMIDPPICGQAVLGTQDSMSPGRGALRYGEGFQFRQKLIAERYGLAGLQGWLGWNREASAIATDWRVWSDSELVNAALAVLAAPDDFGPWFAAQAGRLPKDFELELPNRSIDPVTSARIEFALSTLPASGKLKGSRAEFAAVFARTRPAHLEHEAAKAELKSLVPEDAKLAIGHGIRAKRSKSGAISFDLLNVEDSHAAVQ